MRTNVLVPISAILAIAMTSASYAAPSCCTQGKSATGAGVFSLFPVPLRPAPVAPAPAKNARHQVRRAPIVAPQAIWTGPAVASDYAAAAQVVPATAPAVPPCCAQANPRPVTRQSSCCGQVSPSPVPSQGGCCGRFAPPSSTSAVPSCCSPRANATTPPPSCCSPRTDVAAPRRSCCAAAAPQYAPRQGGCCAHPRACPGCAGPQFRQSPGFTTAPGSCCSPGQRPLWSSPEITSLPAARPAVNLYRLCRADPRGSSAAGSPFDRRAHEQACDSRDQPANRRAFLLPHGTEKSLVIAAVT